MTHEVEQMAYVGQTPWHTLGNLLTPGADLKTWRIQSGLNFDVRESDVYYYIEPTALRKATTRKVLYRSDTSEPLPIVSQDYKVVQPGQVLEFYRDLLADFGFTIETAGVLKGGLKVWALAKTNDSAFLQAQDEIRGYLLLATSYDGSFATTAQFTSVRVVCNNTLQMSLSGESGAIKIGHRSDFNPTGVKAQLGLSRETFDAFAAAAAGLTQIQINAADAHNFYRDVMKISRDNLLIKPNEATERNLADALTVKFDTQSFIGPDRSAWGLVNVVTEYLDHVRRQSVEGSRLDSAWFGRGAVLKQRAWNQALELV